MTLHEFLDCNYREDGDEVLKQKLTDGENVEARWDENGETPLLVATRRRRCTAVEVLLDHGADINARTSHGKTAYAHAIRRGFHEVAELLVARGADTMLNAADQFAVAVGKGDLQLAREILATNSGVAKTGNPDEDRLLADMAGRDNTEAVRFLIETGADLTATGLDSGTALHQACWFGQPANARLLIDAGAPLNIFDATHNSTPLHWAVHGGRYSGGCEERQANYVELVRMLLDAGAGLSYPNDDSGEYKQRLFCDATPQITSVLNEVIGDVR